MRVVRQINTELENTNSHITLFVFLALCTDKQPCVSAWFNRQAAAQTKARRGYPAMGKFDRDDLRQSALPSGYPLELKALNGPLTLPLEGNVLSCNELLQVGWNG
jgi:hypothetical protein